MMHRYGALARGLSLDAKTCGTCGRVYRTEDDFLSGTSRWRVCDRGILWFNCGCRTTMMVEKGRFDWYSPEAKMSDEARSVFNRLVQLKEIPHIPTTIMEVQSLLQTPNVTAREVAQAIKKEPLVASGLLQVANNLKAGRLQRIESLEHAVAYAGFQTLSDLLLIASVRAFKIDCAKFRPDNFWREAFLTGLVAENLGRRFCPYLASDMVYLAGCLANIGKVVQAMCFPDEVDRIVEDTTRPSDLKNWTVAEFNNDVPSHQILGEIASCVWGLPEYVTGVAGSHHDAESVDAIGLEEIVKLANQLTHWLLFQPSRMDKAVFESSLRLFNLDELAVERIVSELVPLRTRVDEILGAE